jgi:hypothetical protein
MYLQKCSIGHYGSRHPNSVIKTRQKQMDTLLPRLHPS